MNPRFSSLSPSSKSRKQGNFIGIFDTSCMRKAFWKSRYFYLPRHVFDSIQGCCLTFYIWICCYYNLLNKRRLTNATKKSFIIQLIWHSSRYRRYHSAKNMIESSIYPCPLNRKHIKIIFDNTKKSRISFCIRTDDTSIMHFISHTMTHWTLLDILMEICESFRKIFYIWGVCLEKKKGELRCSFFSDSWEKMYHINNSLKCLWHFYI